MAYSIENRGYKGWLERNYKDIMNFQRKYARLVTVVPRKGGKEFKVTARGRGRFASGRLCFVCSYPNPGQPPTLENISISGAGDHPHINDLYFCVKAAWTPASPITVSLEAAMAAWWYPNV